MWQLGHRTFAELLRASLADSSTVDFQSAWYSDASAGWAHAVNRLLARRTLDYLTNRNIDLVRLRTELGQSLLARCCLHDKAARRQADLVHLHTQSLAFLSIDVMRRVPTVISGDLTAVLAARMYHSWYWHWTYAANIIFERAAFRAATAIVMMSEWAKASVVKDYGVPSARVQVIPPGVNIAEFSAIPLERPVADRPVRLLFVGGDFHRKGGPLLADVFITKFADLGCELHVVTSPKSEVPSHPKIFVYRNVTAYSPKWLELYANSDIFALPTRGEAFGIAYVEAMAAALPVIGTDVGAGSEIIDDSHNGYLISPNDPRALTDRIAVLLSDVSLRRRLGAYGRSRAVRDFNGKTNAARLAALFVKVITEQTKSPH